jgi:superfamily II DNA or RNA helicase|tara:strand:- start:4251 stop:5711 length:1461 start_codon:yes stop_codon:yes gene_type:complete
MIVFRKKDDVYLTFDGDRHDLQQLSDYFTFKVPGAEFSPQYRNKFWDGKIRLVNLRNYTLYAGLWQEIVKFAKDLDVKVEFEGNKFDYPGREQPVTDEMLDGFLNILKPYNKQGRIDIRDYQREAFKSAVRQQRVLLLSPTASGKSLIAYALCRWWEQTHDRKVLIIVPTISLVSQMIGDFKEYSSNKFFAHGISGGLDKDTDLRCVVSTWQSIHKMSPGWFAQFGSVIVDEVHHAQAKSIQKIMNNLLICPDRIGLTGTLQEAKTHELVLKGLFGPVHKVISTKELIDRNQVSDLQVRILTFNYKDEERKTVSKYTYQEEIDFLITNEKRNKIIAKMAGDLPGNTLVVFSRLDHGKTIFDLIDTEKDLHYVAGETDKETREAVRALAEHNDTIIVASLGVFSTGINIRNLHNLIFAHPSKSKIKVLQSIGRVLRVSDTGRKAIVFDIVDDLKHRARDNFALRHANERFKFYIDESFDFKISKIEL